MAGDRDLKDFLDQKYMEFNVPGFVKDDPVSIPHLFTKNQDIEIAGFFAAILAWGQRITIIRNCQTLMEGMDNSPHDFLLNHEEQDLVRFQNFVHRTFQPIDLLYFIHFLSGHYKNHDSLEVAFNRGISDKMYDRLVAFHHYFFDSPYIPDRTRKHIATPERNSSCKRLNMYLRWMVRKDNRGVDFGIWNMIPMSGLVCPFDVHVGRVSRKLGLVKRKQNDWKATMELTEVLRRFDAEDPVKYDFALFGLGLEHF